MKVVYKKKLKNSSDIEVGDQLRIAGLVCVVTKAETVFYRTPNSRVRLALDIVGSTPKSAEVILFFNHGVPVETLK